MKVNSNYKMGNQSLYYEILDNGFDIYVEASDVPFMHQPEPFIPDHSKTYTENAIEMCKSLAYDAPDESGPVSKTVEERLTDVEANIDYLMLLTDADSATESDDSEE